MTKREITVEKDNWILYADSVSDNNPIHRDRGYAISKGLDDCNAPGMFMFSHLESGNPITSIKDIRFNKPTYSGDTLSIQKSKGGRNGYTFFKGDDKMCMVLGLVEGDYKSNGIANYHPSNPLHVTNFVITQDDVDQFMNSIGRNSNDTLPSTLLASTSARALLDLGKSRSWNDGIHLTQSFQQFGPYELDTPIQVYFTKEEVVKGTKRKYNLSWMQRDLLIARGSSKIDFLEDNT